MQQETEAAIAAGASKFTAAAGATSIAGWLNANNIAAVLGAAAAIAGAIVTWYYKRKADRREAEYKAKADARDAELHAARLADLREENQQWQ